LALLGAAQAQEAGTKLERVEITGSSIKRIDAETALPVQILKREDIERVGASSTEELVKQLSSLGSGNAISTVAPAAGTTTGSIATVSLRDLGGARTLVLLNGRRLSVYGGGAVGAAGSSVDINSIPLAAIERVEVLKDGASAIYGSDAIAGVVNFILRKEYSGVEASATYGTPAAGPGMDRKASVFGGVGKLGSDGYNLSYGISLQKTDPIFGSDRGYAKRINVENLNDVTSSITFPANVTVYSSGALKAPTLPNCGPVSLVSPYTPARCSFDNSPYDSLQPLSEKMNLLFNGRKVLGGDMEAYFESNFSRVKTTSTSQPVPITGGAVTIASDPYAAAFKAYVAQYPGLAPYAKTFNVAGFLLPPTSPYYPAAFAAANGMAGLPLFMNYRDIANGARNTRDTADNTRLLGGIKGSAAGWEWDAALSYNESKVTDDLLTGWGLYSKILPILNSGVINPLGDTTDQSALAAMVAGEFRGTAYATKTSNTALDFKATRDLWAMADGNAALAVGGSYRKEDFDYNPSVALQTGDVAGLGGNSLPVSASRNVTSAYAEISLPLAKKLEADFAARYDNYERVGSTWNPKASVRWQPMDWLLLRSSLGTGFRAPSLTDLYAPQTTSVTANGTRDPIRCPNISTGAPSDCNFQFTTILGGNPNLKPEKSQSGTFGIVLEPVKNLSVELDYFRVNLKDAIAVGGLNYTYFMANAARAAQYASFIQRGAPDSNPSGVGPVTAILQTNANLFKVQVGGVDVDIKYAWKTEGGDRWNFNLSGTYLDKYDSQNPDGTYTSALDQAQSATSGVIVRWKHNANLAWQGAEWGASLSQNYQKYYTDTLANHAPAGSAPPHVGAYQTFDTQVQYTGYKSFKFIVGVKNLLGVDPPYTNVTSNFLGGYDINYGDPRGRFIYVTGTYTYK
jgi:iron complex outermembrane receptor protein